MTELSAQTTAAASGDRPGMYVPARFIPVPTTISPQAQELLSLPNPYGNDVEPDPSDKAAWVKRVSEGSEQFTKMLEQRFAPYRPERQTEHALSNAVMYQIDPTSSVTNGLTGKAIFYVHGGGFTTGGGIAAAYACYQIAHMSGLTTFSIDYRMPPHFPFPAGLDDCVEAYRTLVDRYGAENIAAYGASAGAGLLASCLLKARDLGITMPKACVLQSPESDLTESGDSFETNLGVDQVLKRLTNSIALYADGHDLKDPYLSPLFGDFTKGFPDTYLSAGTRDLFLSNTILLHRALRRAKIPADLNIWEGMGHAGFFGLAPEDQESLTEQVDFIRDRLK